MFKLKVQCFSEPSVTLDGGPSPLEGLVLLQPDSYVCYDGFNDKAAELICGELGFPAAEEYSTQSLPRTATRNKTQRLTCSQDSKRVMGCSLATTECPSDKLARLKCRVPGFLGCYQGDYQVFQAYPGYEVHSYEECASTCVRRPIRYDTAVMHRNMCSCFQQMDYSGCSSTCSHSWECPNNTNEPTESCEDMVSRSGNTPE
ncbi:uncharacterized protein [Diadema setosum]|uniref:uncharacterized protein n=1 Tax=Diadema setosum TaxID=31175 RepID=UPI003B3B2C7A